VRIVIEATAEFTWLISAQIMAALFVTIITLS
jgi:hypothetical protein